MQYLQWLATLLGLVEQYATIRASGGTSVEANMSVLNAATSILNHATAHPALLPIAPVTRAADQTDAVGSVAEAGHVDSAAS